ncbi:MAG: hypothetical protein K2K48_03430 [Anaeroplasmataceae bacterium]|nr:hypothetical protein [Anaeroplasmataceae bacterium]
MYNNALFGFMIQKSICEKFNIKVSSDRLINTFYANYDDRLKDYIDNIVSSIFGQIDLTPVKCTTLELDSKGNIVPYNFILSDYSTLSIRTNINGDKVAPRIIGQAGFEKLNIYFSKIYGKQIVDQNDIKHLICEKTEKVVPIFLNFLLDADHILWIFPKENKFVYHLIDGTLYINMDFKKEKFAFTKNYDEWNESTTLKYDGKSIAEVQVHKNRSFKFRFIMNNLLPLLKEK